MNSSCEWYMNAQRAKIERNRKRVEKAARESSELRKRLLEDAPTREKLKSSLPNTRL